MRDGRLKGGVFALGVGIPYKGEGRFSTMGPYLWYTFLAYTTPAYGFGLPPPSDNFAFHRALSLEWIAYPMILANGRTPLIVGAGVVLYDSTKVPDRTAVDCLTFRVGMPAGKVLPHTVLRIESVLWVNFRTGFYFFWPVVLGLSI